MLVACSRTETTPSSSKSREVRVVEFRVDRMSEGLEVLGELRRHQIAAREGEGSKIFSIYVPMEQAVRARELLKTNDLVISNRIELLEEPLGKRNEAPRLSR